MYKNMLVEQNKEYALGNFVMLTPTIKKLSEIHNKPIDVYFNHDYVKQCFIDCEFINHVNSLYEKPYLTSGLINKKIPDYQFVYKTIIKDGYLVILPEISINRNYNEYYGNNFMEEDKEYSSGNNDIIDDQKLILMINNIN